ncbi:hypothetical protein [Buchnera aphidicola]|nr:hypothetical protein [Buchnera aphidicola]
MKIIYSEQLFPTFFNGLSPYYILIGDDTFFVQESKKIIFSLAKKNGFSKLSTKIIEHNISIKHLSYYFKMNDLFSKKKLLF